MSPSQPWRRFLLLLVVYHLIQLDGCLLLDGSKKLKVVGMGARGLKPDFWSETDAYVKVSYGFTSKMTSSIDNDNNPNWNHDFEFSIDDPSYELQFDVYDDDVFFDDLLGRCVVPVRTGPGSCDLETGGRFFYSVSIS